MFERPVEELSRWPHERMAREIFLVARLLADEHDARRSRTFAEHGLRADHPQVTAATPLGGLAQGGDGATSREEIGGGGHADSLGILCSGGNCNHG